MTTAKCAIVLFAHGARDPQWAQPFEKIQRIVSGREPGTPVELAFLECMQPTLMQVIESLAARGVELCTIVPLFMAQGGHLKHDLPLLLERVRAQTPGMVMSVTPPIGEVEQVLELIAAWVSAAHAGHYAPAAIQHPIA